MKKLSLLALIGIGVLVGLSANDIKRYVEMRRM